MDPASFIYVTCQVGAEPTLKAEFARRWPGLRFAYSRPGFITFKSAEPLDQRQDVPCRDAVFARATGQSLGKVQAETPEARAAAVWELLGDSAGEYDGLHVWARDRRPPRERDLKPKVPQEAIDAANLLRAADPLATPAVGEEAENGEAPTVANARPQDETPEETEVTPTETGAVETEGNETAAIETKGTETGPMPKRRLRTWVQPGANVLDIILVEPDVWWVGRHPATTTASCWPGGFCRINVREPIISRAYFKVEEALQWTGLPFRKGERVADLGCAPGGASQALLARGMRVYGVDPANPDPSLFENLNFWHEKKRGADVRRKHFADIPWLVADMNVAPNYTLDTVEGIVTHDEVHIRGMLLTLKLLEWDLAAEISDYVFRVRTWGFKHVQVRQLAANRQEVCLAAWKD